MSRFFSPLNFSWILTGLGIGIFSLLYQQNVSFHFKGGLNYILLNLAYLLILFLSRHKFSEKNSLDLLPFILGSLFLLMGDPLFENDQYRYLWEGKVIAAGHNPYQLPPNSPLLSSLYFEKHSLIYAPQLTTIYPPIALGIFTLLSPLSYEWGLRILMLLSAFLIWHILKFCQSKGAHPLHLALVFPYLQKEFIQGVHIDSLAVAFFLLSLYATRFTLLFHFASFFTKLLNIITAPFQIDPREGLSKQIHRLLYLLLPLPLLIGFAVFFMDFEKLSGVRAFTSHWYWNPGLYSLFYQVLELPLWWSRLLCLASYTLYYLFIFSLFYAKRLDREKSFLLIFAGLLFFSPVFNPWYALWFLPFALIQRSKYAILAVFFSCMSYMAYGSLPLVPYALVLTHIWFPLLLLDERKNLLTRNC